MSLSSDATEGAGRQWKTSLDQAIPHIQAKLDAGDVAGAIDLAEVALQESQQVANADQADWAAPMETGRRIAEVFGLPAVSERYRKLAPDQSEFQRLLWELSDQDKWRHVWKLEEAGRIDELRAVIAQIVADDQQALGRHDVLTERNRNGQFTYYRRRGMDAQAEQLRQQAYADVELCPHLAPLLAEALAAGAKVWEFVIDSNGSRFVKLDDLPGLTSARSRHHLPQSVRDFETTTGTFIQIDLKGFECDEHRHRLVGEFD
jgi:hypothetical protein